MKYLRHFLIICLFLSVALNSTIVYADATNPIISIKDPPLQDANEKETGSIFTVCDEANKAIADKVSFKNSNGYDVQFLSCKYVKAKGNIPNCCNVTVNMAVYRSLNTQDKQKVMQLALDTIFDSKISRTNRNKIYNELCALDTFSSGKARQLSDNVNTDFAHAYSYFKPFSSPIGVVLGCLTIAMFLLLAFTMILDIAYITIPAIQELFGRISKSENPVLTSIEAINAVKESESKAGQEYVNPLGLYFKSKVKQYIAMAICILYLVSGQIFTLLANFIDYFNTIVNL